MGERKTIEQLLSVVPVLPLVTLARAQDAADIARALARGGFAAIEITLRTPAGLAAIEAISRQVPEIIVGAGTILSPEDLRLAAAAGAVFAVSPGATPALLAAGRDGSLAYLPGVATASEIQSGVEAGYRCFKFFPAAGAGGIAALKAFSGPFPQVRFCATGGIVPETAQSYLDLPNVLSIGASWLAPERLVSQRDWTAIETLARDATSRLARRTSH